MDAKRTEALELAIKDIRANVEHYAESGEYPAARLSNVVIEGCQHILDSRARGYATNHDFLQLATALINLVVEIAVDKGDPVFPGKGGQG